MPIASASVDAFIVTAVAVAAPTFILLRRRQSLSQSPYRAWLTFLVTLHTVYVVYVLTIQYPPNLFQRLHIPLTMPASGIRALLLQRAHLSLDAALPKPLEGLLTRLSSFDTRMAYVRFGQTVLQDCQHCKTLDQYALYALPGPLAQYIREAALLGLLTAGPTHRARWRIHSIVVLVAAGLLEGYFAATAPIHIPRDGRNVFMLHDTLWLLRHLLFLLLPIFAHALPHTNPLPSPLDSILATRGALERTLRRVAYLKLLRAAVLRDSQLRQSSSRWWAEKHVLGSDVRTDEGVQALAERLGIGFGEGHVEGGGRKMGVLSARVKEVAAQLKFAALAPPEPIQPPRQA